MPVISDSALLQALGWSALNSIWQTGILWCITWVINYLIHPTSTKKYLLSVACILASFLLFLGNIFYYIHLSNHFLTWKVIGSSFIISSKWFSVILDSASIAYLLLLLLPIYRLYKNLRFIKVLKYGAMYKVDLEKRLYVQKMSQLMGIKKQVSIFISESILSPVTIGFIKPVILLPIASFNNLTLQQVEAVLLHELAHIRRCDYLINIFINISNTILYFNPFLKLFIHLAESCREECCDQMVLQFGYNKVSYATALLQLEKAKVQNHIFTMEAIGKSPLLQRIEKIAGVTSHPSSIKFSQFASLLVVILFAFFFQTLFTDSHLKNGGKPFVFSNFASPYYFIASEENDEDLNSFKHQIGNIVQNKSVLPIKSHSQNIHLIDQNSIERVPTIAEEPSIPDQVLPVVLNETSVQLTNAEKKQVQNTLGLVKEVLITYEWKNLKKSIPDGLTENEHNSAYREYLCEVKKINWQNLEQSLLSDYNNINWRNLEANLQNKLNNNVKDSLFSEIKDTVTTETLIISEETVQKPDTTETSPKKIIKL